MINELFTLRTTIERIRQGPLSGQLDCYAVAQKARGYSHHSIRQQIVAISDFSRWLDRKQIAIRHLDTDVVEQFLRFRQRPSRVRRGDKKALNAMIDLLVDAGIVILKQPVRASASSQVVDDFRQYLLQERRLSEATLLNYAPVVEQFLSARFGNRTPRFAGVTASDVTAFVTRTPGA